MKLDLNTWSADLRAVAYPSQMVFIDRGITGAGFYPGARGCMWGPDSAPCVMLLGRDFGTLSYYHPLAATPGRREYALTWRHTRDLYVRQLNRARVFCTNFLMGARVDGSAKGDIRQRLTALEWQEYEASCWEFLKRQIRETQPELIVVFGADNQRDLSKADRLGAANKKLMYAPHPHSAIGTQRAKPHQAVCEEIKLRLGN